MNSDGNTWEESVGRHHDDIGPSDMKQRMKPLTMQTLYVRYTAKESQDTIYSLIYDRGAFRKSFWKAWRKKQIKKKHHRNGRDRAIFEERKRVGGWAGVGERKGSVPPISVVPQTTT